MQNFLRIGLPLLTLGAAILAYLGGYLPETGVGAALAAAAVVIPGLYAAKVVGDTATSTKAAVPMLIVAGLATVLAAIPVYFALQPGAAQYSGQLSETNKSLNIGSVAGGAYVLTVDGSLGEHEGEVTADYRLKVTTNNQSQFVDGQLWRRFDRVRAGRRGSAMQERSHTFENHPVHLAAGETEIALVKNAAELSQGLRFELHKVLLPAGWFWAMAGIIYVFAAYLEARFASEKNRSVLTAALGFVFFMAYWVPNQISPQSVVRPVIGSAIISGLGGVLAGGVVSWLARRIFKNIASQAPKTAKGQSANVEVLR